MGVAPSTFNTIVKVIHSNNSWCKTRYYLV